MRTCLTIILVTLTLLLRADTQTVHVIHTADIHAHLLPDDRGNGGWLKAATVIARLRQQVTPENSLLIDCGDTVQGTLGASLSQGMVAMPPLDYLNYDVWVPGNHELDYGIPRFLEFMALNSKRTLCANLTIKGQPPFTPWKLFTKQGVRIAVIGLNSSFLKEWQLPQEEHLLEITPAHTLLPRLLAEILPLKPHVIILAAHQGWFAGKDPRAANEIRDIATDFPEIDLILGAHTHRLIPGTLIGKRTWYTQPQAHGNYVAHIQITVSKDRKEPPVITSRTIPVTADIPVDPKLQQLLQPWLDRERREQQRIIAGKLGQTVHARGTPGRTCQTSELIAAAIASAVNAPVAFHGRLTRKDLPAGQITAGQLYDVIPYDNHIVTAELTKNELQHVLTEQLKWKGNSCFNGVYGVTTRRDGQDKIVLHTLGIGGTDFRQIPDSRKIKVAFNSHAAAGSGRFPTLRKLLAKPGTKTTKHPITTRKALEIFIVNNPGWVVKTQPWLAR